MADVKIYSSKGEPFTIDDSELQGALQSGYTLAENRMPGLEQRIVEMDQRPAPQEQFRQPSEQEISQSGFNPMASLMQSSPMQTAVGLGQGLKEMLGAPFGIKPEQSGEGEFYNAAREYGAPLLGMYGGGAALNAARGAAESLPLVGKLAQYLGKENVLPSMLNQGTGNALFAASQHPENALAEGALGFAAGAIPAGVISFGKKTYQKLSPTLAATRFGEVIKDTAASFKEKANELYAPLMQKFGDKSIYGANISTPSLKEIGASFAGQKTPRYTGPEQRIPKDSAYANLDKKYTNRLVGDIEGMHENFIKNPTLTNAHEYQSQLGYEIRALQKKKRSGDLDPKGENVLTAYKKAQSALQKDSHKFLNEESPNLSKLYDLATEQYAKTVVPFYKNKDMAQIIYGEKNLKPKDLKKISEQINSNDFLKSILGEKASTIEARAGLPHAFAESKYGKVITGMGKAMAIPQAIKATGNLAEKTVPKTYELLRNALMSQIFRGNQ